MSITSGANDTTTTTTEAGQAAQRALATLLSRRSNSFVVAPAPSASELDLIFQAAARAPDHGTLRPWHFRVIEGAAIGRLGDFVLGEVKASGDPRMTAEKEAAVRAWLAKVPLIVALGYEIHHDHPKVPQWEQQVSTGAAVMNMLNAAHLLGYGAFWSTGLGTSLDSVREGLGFDPLSYDFLGYLIIGTPELQAQDVKRPAPSSFVSSWTAPESL